VATIVTPKKGELPMKSYPRCLFFSLLAVGCTPKISEKPDTLPSTMSALEGLQKCADARVSGSEAGVDTLWCANGGANAWFEYQRAEQTLSKKMEVSVESEWIVDIPSEATREIWRCAPANPSFWVAFSAHDVLVKPVNLVGVGWEKVELEEPFSIFLYRKETAPPRDVFLEGTLSSGVGHIPDDPSRAHLPEFDGELGVSYRRNSGTEEAIPTHTDCKRWFVVAK